MTLHADLRAHFVELRAKRREGKLSAGRRPRLALSAEERVQVLEKTDRRCHICGGAIGDEKWHADHVIAHSAGGAHRVDNYLPAHSLCNNYRWDYLPEEFQSIMKLGVWARTQIERGTSLGDDIANAFLAHEVKRTKRRKLARVWSAPNKSLERTRGR
jgi:hypothetical protein